ncbi:FMN-binding negative transcriptional regulator [Sphingomonas cavernae]|uniref:FMN-binding negative transcriptional regulator n=1 Tax=Sphingomonas cavernae TaxID=2320861 RepID=A0A418WRN6_9SPHN|nr:FMN-binding negative transcriptional regulator [Sphingomonas cavernae]RJF93914.1 FMN-binding negative transcriptional regulator [Sphingomonas cavernae]
MHPNPQFRWEDRDALRGFVTEIGFGALFAATPDGPRVAHVPTVFLDDATLGFHVARGNGIARHLDGATALYVVQGPEAYISPDWYGMEDQVPTWNYLAVELEGQVRKMEREQLVEQIDRLSGVHEARLAPKPTWTPAKMTPGLVDKMLGAITGYTLEITAWRGTKKLGQNKPAAARNAAADALEMAGNRAMAHLMREMPL